MNFTYKSAIELIIDFTRGVHVWPVINWILTRISSLSNNESWGSEFSIDLHLIVASVVLFEAIFSIFVRHKNSTHILDDENE